MDLFYGRAGAIEKADTGWMEGDDPVTARVQPRLHAPAGVGRSASLGNIWCVVRHDGACRLTLTPVVNGTVREDLAETYDFDELDAVTDEVVRLYMSEAVTFPGDTVPFSRQALRGTWLSVRATLTPLMGDSGLPEGEMYALGGFEVEHRSLASNAPSIPAVTSG